MNLLNILLSYRFNLFITGLLFSTTIMAELENRGNIALRYDIRENISPRWQYQLRGYTKINFSKPWSLNSFVSSGCSFDSGYNEIYPENNDCLRVRRLYLKHKNDKGKLEIGVIPPYKGKVSSTGLAKDGWISGTRWVTNTNVGQYEAVLGEVNNIDSPNAFQSISEFNYFEFEFSSVKFGSNSFEIATERILKENYIRGELRYFFNSGHQIAAELINTLGEDSYKSVLSHKTNLSLGNYPIELFSFFSYVDKNFGQRAELTEDFVNFGKSIVSEAEGRLFKTLDWFLKLESGEIQSRAQIGFKNTF